MDYPSLTLSPLATMWTVQTVYKMSKLTHYMDKPNSPPHTHTIPTTTVPMAPVPFLMILMSQLLERFCICIWTDVSSQDYLKETFLVRTVPRLRGPISRKLISCVCHRSMKLWEVECRVTGRRCISEMTCWWPGGEEALFSFTAEDRNVARTRRMTGMPHIPRCWKQSKVGKWEKNQISTKRCQQ